MLISEVIEDVKAYCKGTWDGHVIDETTTRDKVLWGPTDVECTGIVTTCFASADVIREAARRGANLIISHEALFWNHGDHTARLVNNKKFQAKRGLLDGAGITVWRCHDYIHSGIPKNGVYVDGIFTGLISKLGWRDYLVDSVEMPMEYVIPKTTAGDLACFLVDRLGLNGTRIVGDATADVRRVCFPMHVIGEFDNDVTSHTEENDIDCLISMELTDFTVSEYVRDSAQLGRSKAIITIGHFIVEEPGMEYMIGWLPDALGCRLPTSFIASGDPFGYVTA